MKLITLQQDAGEKIIISMEEFPLLLRVQRYFKWRKDITVARVNRLGTAERDKFIKYLSK